MAKGQGPKAPARQWYMRDWLTDPNLSQCRPETRGVWMDLLAHMHLADGSGVLRGTVDQLARMARCTVEEMGRSLRELSSTKTAHVTPCNKNVLESNSVVTVKNRRMMREHKEREQTRLRVQRHRKKRGCNGQDTLF